MTRAWRPKLVALDVDGGWGETVKTRLERFLLRVDCRIDGPVPDLTAIAVRGPASAGVDVWSQDQLMRAPSGWPGIDGFDVVIHCGTAHDSVHSTTAQLRAGGMPCVSD